MDNLKKFLNILRNTLSDEVYLARKIKGAKLDRFCEDLYLDKDIIIYYTKYNIIFIRECDFNQINPYLKQSDLVMKLDMPSSNLFICIYQYFNSSLLEDYIG